MDAPERKIHTALLAILRSGLWEREIDDPACFPLSDDERERLFRQARRQTVTGIVFRGMQYLPDTMLPTDSLLIRWTARVDAIERRNLEMNRALSELYGEFRAQGIDPVLQKGQGVACLYESPLLRECGDIDLCFQDPEAAKRAEQLVRQNGIRIRKMPDRSIFYLWHGLEVEHHVRLLDLHNPFLQHEADKLARTKGCIHMRLAQELEPMTVPSPFLNLLLLDLHILKHTLGRGIGLRQLCDMARACYRLHREVNPEEMKNYCRRWGLARWNPLLHAFLVDCLGLPAACLPYEETAPDARVLLDIVWKGGNFGQYRSDRETGGRPGWIHKMHTARSFCRNLRFAAAYAPKEAFWIFADLAKGQLG